MTKESESALRKEAKSIFDKSYDKNQKKKKYLLWLINIAS